MGRRKIEIKAIKDDRNRSVTFLKRKGGLFKKAHELSVLCSVDVAVIIFGNNKKLYEFSSGDINEMIGRHQYYGNAHEHKGPADFNGRGNVDDDDDDDMGATPPEAQEMHMPHAPFQQPGFPQHMRQHTPSASPPVPNGTTFRHSTPQPPGLDRPSSRNQGRRSSLVPPNHGPVTQGPPMQNGHPYMPTPNAPMYNPQAGAGMPVQPHPHYQPPTSQYQQPQNAYVHDQRRTSVPPPTFSEEPVPPPNSNPSPPSPPRAPANLQVKRKGRSIFTPIDQSRSDLAQLWGFGTTTTEPQKTESTPPKATQPPPRSQSVDPPRPARVPRSEGGSIGSIQEITGPARSDSSLTDSRRPRLKVHIPSEQSDGGSATAESSPKDSGTAGGPSAKATTDGSHSSGVVLPPPSPSASALMSAGAQGPPNPFARPHPPGGSGGLTSDRNTNETPISALPSRFVDHGLLPSPSSFYPEWGFGGKSGDSNMLPSPLNFQTPITSAGPSFLRDDSTPDTKRKSPDGDEGGGGKRLKVEQS